jgi:ketosteroid isomerase-like protein
MELPRRRSYGQPCVRDTKEPPMPTTEPAVAPAADPGTAAAVRARLDQIWAACADRDFDRLESFHLYGPRFTSFKNGAPREGADGTAAEERGFFSMIESPAVDMRDLAVNSFGPVAIATFNGHHTGVIHGETVAVDMQATIVLVSTDDGWRIVHEHFSPLGAP